MTRLFPMFMKLTGKQSLVVGAGKVGGPKIGGLIDTGATRAYLSSSELYSVGRFVVWSPYSLGVGSGCSGRRPGLSQMSPNRESSV